MKLTKYNRLFKIILFTILYKISAYKIPFLDVQIDSNNNDRFITSSYKNLPTIISAPPISKVNNPSAYKRSIIKTLISRAKLLSSSRTLFLNELKNIKQTLMNNGFPNYIADTEIKQFINKP